MIEKKSFSTPQGATDIFYYDRMTLPILKNLNAIYITDSNIVSLLEKADNFFPHIPIVEIKAGEEQKDFSSIQIILNEALKHRLDRDCIFIAVGGGIICDLTAFAASIYMRGVRCIFVPTSLLAMTDASIGGKTAINFSSYKNIAGTFFKAEGIYISPEWLKTLPVKEYFSGLAEILKIALLKSKPLYEIIQNEKIKLLEVNSHKILEIIKLAIDSKVSVVSEDFYENGIRSFLNFGHTFAHALEAFINFINITHGEAVAWGIGRALELGCNLRKTDFSYAEEVLTLLNFFGWCSTSIPLVIASDKSFKRKKNFADEIISKMRMDKKNKNGNIRLVMQKNLNINFLHEVNEEEIRQVLI